MKHVIVIETSDPPEGQPIDRYLAGYLTSRIEKALDAANVLAVVRDSYNQNSAIAAIHEMYNAPKWNGGTVTSTK